LCYIYVVKKGIVKQLGLFIILILFVLRGGLYSFQDTSTEDEIVVVAGYKEKIKEMIIAKTNVEVHYKKISVFGDMVQVNLETKDVRAEGNVTIRMENEIIRVDEIDLNLDSKIMEMTDVQGMAQPIILYEAESAKRKEENLYQLNKAWITSCSQPVPRWKFSCSKANFKKDDYVEMWGAVFSLKKVPIFYFPYMRYPLGKERSTGFLIPSLGFTGRKGMTFSQAFFWAIRDNMDATFQYDYYSYRGMGGGLEYRYIFPKGTNGEFELYYFKFKQTSEQEELDNASILRFTHNQMLPANFRLVANVDYQSSYDFLREFDNNFRRAVVSNRSSQIYLSRAWSNFNWNMRVSRFDTYSSLIDMSVIRQSLPEISFSSNKIKMISPLYFSFNSAFSSWQYGWDYQYEKDTQRRSQDFSFNPTLTIPFTSIPWLTLNSSVAANFFYYFKSYAPNTKNVVDEPLLRKDYSINLEFRGPSFYKIFFDSENVPKVKHIIEPIFTYRYESPVSDSDRIITSSYYFYRNHYLKYGLYNSLLVKTEDMPSGREMFSLRLEQNYYLEPEDSPLKPYRLENGEIPRFSDINGYLRFNPTKTFSLDMSSSYNHYFKVFSTLRFSASAGMSTDPYFLRVSWYKSDNPYSKSILWVRHQVSLYGGAKIPGLPLELLGAFDFNIQEKKLLYSSLNFVYHYQCLDFKADVRVYYFREKPEFQFNISFGLGNIGKTTEFLGGMGF